MSSIIKNLNDEKSIMIILTKDDINIPKGFLNDFKNQDEWALELRNLKNPDKEFSTNLKVYCI